MTQQQITPRSVRLSGGSDEVNAQNIPLNQKKKQPRPPLSKMVSTLKLDPNANLCRIYVYVFAKTHDHLNEPHLHCIAIQLGRVLHLLLWSSEVRNLPLISLPVEAAIPLYTRVLADKV
jgi:hypothetical protein